MLGGGLRQVGVLAACGLYALEHHLERLAEDHRLAEELFQGLSQCLDGRYRLEPPQTNILLVHTDHPDTTQRTLAAWAAKNIRALALGPQLIRLVTHLDLPPHAAELVLERLRQISSMRAKKTMA
jgi:threonine aldolase